MESVMLSNGVKMPVLGYGVYQVAAEECERCVLDALKVGYRSLDTAQSYFNEAQVGSAMRKSGVPREEIFLTTKVWVEHYGYEAAKASVLESMEKLQTDYLDLVLLHQPFGDYYGAYRALEDLYIQGRVRAIGVSNFYPDRLVDLASFAHIRPMVNQVEIHPYPDPSIYPPSPPAGGGSEMERYEQREQIKANIDYDYLSRQCPYDDVESLLELIVDVVSSTASTIRIGKEVLPAETVKRRFLQLDSSHIEYVIDSLKQTTTKINNIRAYLLTALYNAPVTIGPYYSAAVRHDFG